MARRTKLEAEQTNMKIIRAALLLFANNGVHQTTLEQIATAANVTRGAIYWHFANKNEILQAIGEYVGTILTARINVAASDKKPADPLAYLELYLQKIICEIQRDEEIYQAFAILNCKCEYITEYRAVLDRMTFCYHEHINIFTNLYNAAIDNNSLRLSLSSQELAIDTYAFLTGLIRLLLIERDTIADISKIITLHINLRRKNST